MPAALPQLLAMHSSRVHLIGATGIGMAGLARLLAADGHRVTGCDSAPAPRLAAWLASAGIPVASPHDPAHLASADWAIYSPAVPPSHPELAAARQKGLPLYPRGAVLAALANNALPPPSGDAASSRVSGGTQLVASGKSELKNSSLAPPQGGLSAAGRVGEFRTLAVAGTHGKTTTSALLAHLLRSCNIDASFCVGGETCENGAPALPGTAPELVVEADESDGTLALYSPYLALVTNIEFDHADHFPSFDAFRDVFRAFARQSHILLACADDPEAAALAAELSPPLGDAASSRVSGGTQLVASAKSELKNSSLAPPPGGLPASGRVGEFPRVFTYGLSPAAPFRATDLTPSPSGWTFTAVTPAGTTPVRLPLPGLHNVRNALAAIAAATLLPDPPPLAALARACETFKLPRRRLDIHPTPSGITVIADYAHHPTEIRALLSAVRQLYPSSRLVAAFQPHRYTRTRLLGPQFPAAFEGVSAGILLPVYAASEPPIPGATSDALLPLFNRVAPWTLSPDLPSALPLLLSHATPGTILLLLGAGSIDTLLPPLLSALSS